MASRNRLRSTIANDMSSGSTKAAKERLCVTGGCVRMICKLTSALAMSTGHGETSCTWSISYLPSPSSSGSTTLKHTLAAGWGTQGYDGIVEQWRSGDFKWKT